MPKQKLTSRFVETVTVEVRTDYSDTQVTGLSLRVAPSGVKTWNLLYTRQADGEKQRLKLGRFPALTLEGARKKALAQLGEIAAGRPDPVQAKKARLAGATVEELGAEFIRLYAKPRKRSWRDDEMILLNEINPKIGSRKAASITRRDILDIIEAKFEAGAPTRSNSILATVRKMFNWAVDGAHLPISPAAGIRPRGKIVRRDRVLSDSEIKAIWKALPDARIRDATRNLLRVLLLTGQRSGEVCGIVPAELNLEAATWTLPGERTKNGLSHVVPLSAPVVAILRPLADKSEDRFQALFTRTGEPFKSNAVAQAVRLKLQVTGKPWTAHDMRRTVATGMAGIGIAPHIIEAVLNHISGAKAGVAGIYNRQTYEPEKRAALEAWAEHVERLTV